MALPFFLLAKKSNGFLPGLSVQTVYGFMAYMQDLIAVREDVVDLFLHAGIDATWRVAAA